MNRVRYWAGLAAAVTVLLSTLLSLSPPQAGAATASPGARMLAWAQANATGHWYAWGGAGFATYDCSGIIYRAALETGVRAVPRNTFAMLSAGVASGTLVRTYHPVAGDLAFFGPGHVEFVAPGQDMTFGALSTGTRVGYHRWYPGSWWVPTAFYRIM